MLPLTYTFNSFSKLDLEKNLNIKITFSNKNKDQGFL